MLIYAAKLPTQRMKFASLYRYYKKGQDCAQYI